MGVYGVFAIIPYYDWLSLLLYPKTDLFYYKISFTCFDSGDSVVANKQFRVSFSLLENVMITIYYSFTYPTFSGRLSFYEMSDK